MANQPNWIVLGISVLAIILGIFVLTTNWATGEFGTGRGSFELDYTLFGQDAGGEDTGWYDSEADDAEGIGLMRAGIPIVVVGLVALLGGSVASAIPPTVLKQQRLISGGVLLGAGAILLVGSILFTIGISSALGNLKDNTNGAFDWSIGVGMVFAFLVTAIAIGAGVLAFLMKKGPQLALSVEAPQNA